MTSNKITAFVEFAPGIY